MKGICPNCEQVTEQTLVQGREEIMVRGEAIPVNTRYLKCPVCDAEFADPQWPDDPLDEAYREYRARHGMLQPEDIRAFRQQYGLSQKELTALLGWGAVTLSRYENGALQSDAHEQALRLAMQPRNLLRLIRGNPQAIDDAKRAGLVRQLAAQVSESERSLRSIYQERFGRYPADRFSGYRELDMDKLTGAILFFCDGEGVPKTKLNKLLFYADFKHCKEYGTSITGSRYVHLPFGPVPDHYAHLLAALSDEEGALRAEERSSDEYAWEVLVAARPADLHAFSASELKILATVKEHFAGYSASTISALSHGEPAYTETKDGGLISYEHASNLRL